MATVKSQPIVQSRKNGIIIAIPHDAKGVMSRFKTPGDNELVFAPIKGNHPPDNEVNRVEQIVNTRAPAIEDLA